MSDQAPGKNASLRLAEPPELAGEWRITGGTAGPCSVRLEVARVEAANAHALTDAGGCLEGLVGRPVAGWRPAPDGIELAGPDRLAVVLFAWTGDAAVASGPGGRVLTLRRVE
ncbi:AprI/Inh family metalloprotease inhibitor [Sphingomonas lenta]|nr:AprI/Inh family metalloprotease inhibitor [Sphingomonas lenta]